MKTIYPDDGEDDAALIAQADSAMYFAKRHSGSSVFHCEKALDAPVSELPTVDSSQQSSTDSTVSPAEDGVLSVRLQRSEPSPSAGTFDVDDAGFEIPQRRERAVIS